MTLLENVVLEEVFCPGCNGLLDPGVAGFRGYYRQCLERLHHAHMASVRAPALREFLIWPPARGFSDTIVKSLALDNPPNALLHAGVVQVPKTHQAPDKVPREARDDVAVLAALFCGAPVSKCPALAVLGILQEKFTGAPDIFV